MPRTRRRAITVGQQTIASQIPSEGVAWAIPPDLNDSPVMMFPHYFTPYPISVDNVAIATTAPYVATDQYSRVWNDPNSTSQDEHAHDMAVHGGYFRGRPAPRPPIASNFKIEDCKTDILQAQSRGWNGFFVELLGLSGSNYDNSVSLMAAAAALVPDGSFKLVPQIDGNGATGISTDNVAVAAYLKLFYDNPSRWLLPDGRFPVATFKHEAQTVAHWQGVADQMLSAYGITIAWIGIFNSMATAASYPMYAAGFWGKGANPGTINGRSSTDMTTTKGRGQKWIYPVWPQDVRPRSQLADETVGFGSMIAGWQAAIADGVDFILGNTWSDYSEGGEWAVSVHAGWVNLDIATYFITRIKTGAYPAILRDAVYLAHRNQFWDATLSQMTAGTQTTRMAWWDRGASSTPKKNIVDVLTFLTAPADVTVTVGGVDTTWTAPAGMLDVNTTALRTGSVSVVVKRAGVTICSVASPVAVTATPRVDDLEYYKMGSLRGSVGIYSPTNQAPTFMPTRPVGS